MRDSQNGVSVRAYKLIDEDEPSAQIEVGRYADGTVKNELDAKEVKQVADMLYVVAEKMEEGSVS